MIHLYFVGDGERDAKMLPRLVERILETSVNETTTAWARLHKKGRRTYGRKLVFAIRQAIAGGADGLVVVVDRDEAPARMNLRQLQMARDEDRESVLFPAALGEANPHIDAWILDDPVALRRTLNLPNDTQIPTVRKSKYPKDIINEFVELSPRPEPLLNVLADIARQIDTGRCVHKKETGFEAFEKDVAAELGHLATTLRHW